MATELGQAYIQIMPSSKGISSELSKVMGGPAEAVGQETGQKLGGKMMSTLTKVIAAAGIGKVIKDSIYAGGALEQSLGGVETMFKDNSDTVVGYAKDAYRTAGLSANDYMENVTSFSASLLQGLGGDTEKAAEVAHTAMVDMSDNANKFGTDMGSIQNAYQGFAKQNYTMLDNLKLGYGGTKTEMERLLADATKLTGVKYDINNLSDVYEAIHVVQEELGITGTTAEESATTFSGSMGMMKASWQNVLAEISTGGDWQTALSGLTDSVMVFASNLLPMVGNVIGSLPSMLIGILVQAGPSLISSGMGMITDLISGMGAQLPELMTTGTSALMSMIQGIVDGLPALLEAGLQVIVGLANGILESIPVLIEALPSIINGIIEFILGAIPQIIETGVQLLTSLVTNLPAIISAVVAAIPQIVNGLVGSISTMVPRIVTAGVDLLTSLVTNLPTIITSIVQAIPAIIAGLINAITGSLPQLMTAGVDLLTSLITNLPQIIVTIVKAIPQIIVGIVKAIIGAVPQLASAGLDLIKGLWQGISNAASWILEKISGFVSNIIGGIKSFFGIKSPSTVMAGIGKFLDQGLAEGIEDNMRPVSRAMDELGELTTQSFESDFAIKAASPAAMQALTASVAATAADTSTTAKKPALITLILGGQAYKAFVDDITDEQERAVNLALAY